MPRSVLVPLFAALLLATVPGLGFLLPQQPPQQQQRATSSRCVSFGSRIDGHLATILTDAHNTTPPPLHYDDKTSSRRLAAHRTGDDMSSGAVASRADVLKGAAALGLAALGLPVAGARAAEGEGQSYSDDKYKVRTVWVGRKVCRHELCRTILRCMNVCHVSLPVAGVLLQHPQRLAADGHARRHRRAGCVNCDQIIESEGDGTIH